MERVGADFGGTVVDPRKYAKGSIKEAYVKYKNVGMVVPAVGYGGKQLKDLMETINGTPSDTVLIGTPVKLENVIRIKKPFVHVTYDLKIKNADMGSVLKKFLKI